MATGTVFSALLSSDDPTRLRDWYAAVFDASVEKVGDGDGYQVVDLDGFYLMIDSRDDVAGRAQEPARVILNVEVDDVPATATRVDAQGLGWHARPEERGGNWFATAIDPDGNLVQIIRLSDAMEEEAMQASMTPFSGFAVRDVDAAARFYSDVLGLRADRNEMGLLTLHLDRRTRVIVYPKSDHVPAGFTVLNLPVPDIDAAVDDLAAKGVELLRYEDMPCDEKGIMRGRSAGMGPDIAWFADPSGNVLSVLH
jgi:predicted enzyme related to lactoylglutathione lyase